eukprot:s2067_g5.t1
MASYASLLLACCLGMASMHLVFVAQGSAGSSAPQTPGQVSSAQLPGAPDMEDNGMAQAALRFGSGLMLGLVLLAFGQPTFADVEDVVIPVDDKGKTTTLTKEQVVRGKRLFIAACASCHVGGGTRTNQNVGLAIEELSGAQPNRATVEGLVDYLNNPTTYDGLKDISEVHPSIKGGDIWPKMRSMKQQDLYDMSAYILYQNQTIPEKWGGGKESLVLFDRAGGLPHIALQLPVPPKETLPKEVYDEALRRLIHYPSALEERSRYEALALISEQDDPEMALDLLLALGSSEAFKLLRRQAAGEKFFMARLKRFFQVDHQQSCELAVAFRSAVPVDDVCAALEGETRWKHEYLKLLFAQDEIAGQGYHMQMVELFAEYDPMGLLPFLRASERYPLEEALAVCQRKGLREEVAYLLGRAGRVSDALRTGPSGADTDDPWHFWKARKC